MTFRVLPIEHDMLTIVRAVVGALPPFAAASVLRRGVEVAERRTLQDGLTGDALDAFRQVLARGGAQALLRRGGWRRRVHAGITRAARLWDTQPAPLVFTMASYQLACWLTVEPQGNAEPIGSLRPAGTGDELFLYLTCAIFTELQLPLEPLAPMVAESALAQLAFPDALMAHRGPIDPQRVAAVLDMPTLFGGLQADLVHSSVRRVEARKASMTQPEELERLSTLAEARLHVLVDAAVARGAIEPLEFVAEACASIVERDASHPELNPTATLQARQQAREASAGVARVAARVARMYDELRHVGFVDDGYDRAQVLLAAWERHAPALRRAESAT